MPLTSSFGPRWLRYTFRWGGRRRRHAGRWHSALYWLTGLALIEASIWASFYVVWGMLLVTVFMARLIGDAVTLSANTWADRKAKRKANHDAT